VRGTARAALKKRPPMALKKSHPWHLISLA
jgi:hypothetical protein